jgi:hypothetical protein
MVSSDRARYVETLMDMDVALRVVIGARTINLDPADVHTHANRALSLRKKGSV